MTTQSRPRAILIAGPTASGKSAFALALARARNGVIVNADSMQVYAEMRILTARPTLGDEAAVPHRLYGHVSAETAYSVACWLDEAAAAIAAAHAAGMLPIIVGGTGLYFKALLEGLSPIPQIPDGIRSRWRAAGLQMTAEDIHAELARRDPLTARQLHPADRQRVVRALEVFEATGRPLAEWQEVKGRPLLSEHEVARMVVARERADLYARSDARFARMLEDGALEEADRMLRMQLSPELPAMRALGLRPLMSFLRHEIGRDEALATGAQETRHYVKRQLTWLRRYMITWKWLNTKEMESHIGDGFPILDFHH